MCYQCPSYSGGGSSESNYSSANYSLDNLVSSAPSTPSQIEYMVSEPQPINNLEASVSDKSKESKSNYSPKSENKEYQMHSTPEYFTPSTFLEPSRPLTQFINDAESIKDYILETFKLTTGDDLPDNIIITICPEADMAKAMQYEGGTWNSQIQGFALNQKTPRVFIKQGPLDQVMVTVGHELGHVLSERLPNIQDEEAKAFAFSLAWINTIKEHNIANLESNIRVGDPARNGIHNVALSFTQKIITEGTNALDVFRDLAHGALSIKQENAVLNE